MEPKKIIDEIELRMEFKEMLEDLGPEECYYVLAEMLIGAQILCEVIIEYEKENL
jgi:hypothetical protein